MFQLQRNRNRRSRRGALALGAVIATTAASGIAFAADDPIVPGGAPAETVDPVARQSKQPRRVRSRVFVRMTRHVLVGRKVRIGGRVRPRGHRRIAIKLNGRRVRTVRARADGRFRARLRAQGRPGVYGVKVVARKTKRSWGRSRRLKRPLNVYRAALASYYGPGLYGNSTACGKTLTPTTQGVAHKTLPCGTKVRFRLGRRTATVRVIDRGPYSGSREWDLTAATKAKLGFGAVGTVLSTR